MDAMPVTLGQELDGWRAQIEHATERLNDTMKRLVQLAQGGTAVGTGINAHPRFGAKVAVLLEEQTGVAFTSTLGASSNRGQKQLGIEFFKLKL